MSRSPYFLLKTKNYTAVHGIAFANTPPAKISKKKTGVFFYLHAINKMIKLAYLSDYEFFTQQETNNTEYFRSLSFFKYTCMCMEFLF